MITRKTLSTKHVKVLVLDEADAMLSTGFKQQMYDIYRHLPPSTQVVLTSATLTPDVLEVTTKFMHDPVRVLVKRDEVTLEDIKQYFVAVENEKWKFDTLTDLYDTLTISQAVIFCNTKRKTQWLADKLTKSGFSVVRMDGDMNQEERDEIMSIFRKGESRVLVTTDLWARGIDVTQVSVVINYDLPTERATYVHRIGRSGRFGRKGIAINLATHDEMPILKDIEQYYATQIDEMPQKIDEL